MRRTTKEFKPVQRLKKKGVKKRGRESKNADPYRIIYLRIISNL